MLKNINQKLTANGGIQFNSCPFVFGQINVLFHYDQGSRLRLGHFYRCLHDLINTAL